MSVVSSFVLKKLKVNVKVPYFLLCKIVHGFSFHITNVYKLVRKNSNDIEKMNVLLLVV